MKTSLKAGTPLQRRPLLGIILVGLLGTFGGASERSDAPQSPAAHQVPPSQGSEGGYQEGLVTSVEPGSSFTLRYRSGHSQTFKVDAGTRTHALTRWSSTHTWVPC